MILFDEFQKDCTEKIAKINATTNKLDLIREKVEFVKYKMGYYESCMKDYPESSPAYKGYKDNLDFEYSKLGGLRDEYYDLTGKELEL